MLIHFDEEGYKRSGRAAMEKIVIFNDAKRFAEKHIIVNDNLRFSKSFSTYFKEELMVVNRDKIQLKISPDKLLDLLEIDLNPLLRMEDKFKSIDSLLSFDSADGIPAPIIDKSQFEYYTNSSEQNMVLRDARKLIEAINTISHHTKVYPANMVQGVSNLIAYDMRKDMYQPNLHSIRNYGTT